MRQALKDELEFARHTTRQERSTRKEQLEGRQGRVTVQGTFGGWQVGSIRERGRVRRLSFRGSLGPSYEASSMLWGVSWVCRGTLYGVGFGDPTHTSTRQAPYFFLSHIRHLCKCT